MLSYVQIEKLEKKINSKLKDLFYIHDLKEDDKNEAKAYNIVLEALENMGYNINDDRKNENILKFNDFWHNGTRVHIHINKCDLSSLREQTFVLYRNSINYKPLLKKCNFKNDDVVRSWYISIV